MVATIPPRNVAQRDAFENLLVSYLATAVPGRIPGCDGMTTEQMLQSYADLAANGLVPGCRQLQRRHPEFQWDMEIFFHMTVGEVS